MVKFKDFSRPLTNFQVLFKANFIFKDFSRQSCIFKYFSSLYKPCIKLLGHNIGVQAATLIFIFGRGLVISTAQEGKSGNINNLVKGAKY